MSTGSLRLRLFVIILVPLIVLALAVGTWRVIVAQRTAGELFDRNLMFTALAVARDVALSDGDAISPETERLLSETAGGEVRYHVYGPDGVLVTGYAVPPVPLSRLLASAQPFAFFDASYRGAPVRVMRLKDETQIDGLSGTFTVTVWQAREARNALVWDLALRSALVIGSLLLAVAGLVWFGVRLGLKPLLDLEGAISTRSADDLSPIRRQVPEEARGLVGRLNGLFSQVEATLEAQATFVSDAAHQLRNPIAGLRALGEAIQTAPTLEAARTRADDLVAAASRAAALANRLLTLERAQAETAPATGAPVDLRHLVTEVAAEMRPQAPDGVSIETDMSPGPATLRGDPVMLHEALTNLVHNACVHGGPSMSNITIQLSTDGAAVTLLTRNDGRSIPPAQIPKILARFGQAQPGAGSGLGLSIAEAVARQHGGQLDVIPKDDGFAVALRLPLCADADSAAG